MSYFIDFQTLPPNMPSLCIPRTFKNITESLVMEIIQSLQMGQIKNIEIIYTSGKQKNSSKKEDSYKTIFIHFHYWFNNENACRAREYLLTGKEIKIIYRDPWFWKIYAFKNITVMKIVLEILCIDKL
jgi:hypothetical protein